MPKPIPPTYFCLSEWCCLLFQWRGGGLFAGTPLIFLSSILNLFSVNTYFSDSFLSEKCVSAFHFDRRVFLFLFLDPVSFLSQLSLSHAVSIQFLPHFWQTVFICYFPEIMRLSKISTLNISLFPPSHLQTIRIYTVLYYIRSLYPCFKIHPFFQNWCYPVALSVVMELFYICAVQYHNH